VYVVGITGKFSNGSHRSVQHNGIASSDPELAKSRSPVPVSSTYQPYGCKSTMPSLGKGRGCLRGNDLRKHL
jgi:hypothetical protein